MKRWRYTRLEVTIGDLMDEDWLDWLNELGQQGLELVCLKKTETDPEKVIAIFKQHR